MSLIKILSPEKLAQLAASTRGMVFVSTDEGYFWQHAVSLINSFLHHNPDLFLHLHLYDPSEKMVNFLAGMDRVTVSTEQRPESYFVGVARSIKAACNTPDGVLRAQRICRTLKAHDRNKTCGIIAKLIEKIPFAGRFMPEDSLVSYLKRAYYVNQRFVVLDHLMTQFPFTGFIMELDADVAFNSAFPERISHEGSDVAIPYREHVKGQRFLGGVVFLPAGGARDKLIATLASRIDGAINNGLIEWGLDQRILDELIPQFNWQPLEERYWDLNFAEDSVIWVAKGNTKDDPRFLSAQKGGPSIQ